MTIEDEKSRLRRNVHLVLSTIGPDQAERAAALIAEHVAATPEFISAKVVALYASTETEISTRPIFDLARAAGKCCLFPRCIAGHLLEFAEVEDLGELLPGRYGILEPGETRAGADLAQIDLVIVPGLAFDATGARLGRGAGYYDSTFASTQGSGPFLIGVAHSVQIFGAVPTAPHDRKLDAIATESGVSRRA